MRRRHRRKVRRETPKRRCMCICNMTAPCVQVKIKEKVKYLALGASIIRARATP